MSFIYRGKPKQKIAFNIVKSAKDLEKLVPKLPQNECYKFISSSGHFSSISFVKMVGKHSKINELFASTLCVGLKEIAEMDRMKKDGQLENARFVVGKIMESYARNSTRSRLYTGFAEICDKHGWGVAIVNNHSRIILMDTNEGKFVLETSSNLNENPKIEQFSFEKDAELYDFYYGILNTLFERGVEDGGQKKTTGRATTSKRKITFNAG